MNVLFIHGSHKESGGDTVYINLLLPRFSEYNIGAHLISIEKNDGKYTLKTGIQRNSNELHEFASLKEINLFIGKYCNDFKVDLIHIHTIYWPAITRYCLTLRPVVKTPHATDLVCPGTYKFFSNEQNICTIPFGAHCLIHAYTKRCCSRAPARLLGAYYNVLSETREFAKKYSAIVVMSEFVKRECINAGIDGSKIFVIPYFTLPVHSKRPEKLKVSLLYVGRLSQVKGVHILIESIAPLLHENAHVQLDIIGDGPYAPKLKSLVEELMISNQVVFHGWKEKDFINDAIDQCEIFLFPSIYPEAFGISGIEAMMHGKPVIGFNVGGVNTWLKDNETGFLIDRGDIHKMRERIQFLLDNADAREKMGKKAKEVAMEQFIPKVHIERLIKVYADCLIHEGSLSN